MSSATPFAFREAERKVSAASARKARKSLPFSVALRPVKDIEERELENGTWRRNDRRLRVSADDRKLGIELEQKGREAESLLWSASAYSSARRAQTKSMSPAIPKQDSSGVHFDEGVFAVDSLRRSSSQEKAEKDSKEQIPRKTVTAGEKIPSKAQRELQELRDVLAALSEEETITRLEPHLRLSLSELKLLADEASARQTLQPTDETGTKGEGGDESRKRRGKRRSKHRTLGQGGLGDYQDLVKTLLPSLPIQPRAYLSASSQPPNQQSTAKRVVSRGGGMTIAIPLSTREREAEREREREAKLQEWESQQSARAGPALPLSARVRRSLSKEAIAMPLSARNAVVSDGKGTERSERMPRDGTATATDRNSLSVTGEGQRALSSRKGDERKLQSNRSNLILVATGASRREPAPVSLAISSDTLKSYVEDGMDIDWALEEKRFQKKRAKESKTREKEEGKDRKESDGSGLLTKETSSDKRYEEGQAIGDGRSRLQTDTPAWSLERADKEETSERVYREESTESYGNLLPVFDSQQDAGRRRGQLSEQLSFQTAVLSKSLPGSLSESSWRRKQQKEEYIERALAYRRAHLQDQDAKRAIVRSILKNIEARAAALSSRKASRRKKRSKSRQTKQQSPKRRTGAPLPSAEGEGTDESADESDARRDLTRMRELLREDPTFSSAEASAFLSQFVQKAKSLIDFSSPDADEATERASSESQHKTADTGDVAKQLPDSNTAVAVLAEAKSGEVDCVKKEPSERTAVASPALLPRGGMETLIEAEEGKEASKLLTFEEEEASLRETLKLAQKLLKLVAPAARSSPLTSPRKRRAAGTIADQLPPLPALSPKKAAALIEEVQRSFSDLSDDEPKTTSERTTNKTKKQSSTASKRSTGKRGKQRRAHKRPKRFVVGTLLKYTSGKNVEGDKIRFAPPNLVVETPRSQHDIDANFPLARSVRFHQAERAAVSPAPSSAIDEALSLSITLASQRQISEVGRTGGVEDEKNDSSIHEKGGKTVMSSSLPLPISQANGPEFSLSVQSSLESRLLHRTAASPTRDPRDIPVHRKRVRKERIPDGYRRQPHSDEDREEFEKEEDEREKKKKPIWKGKACKVRVPPVSKKKSFTYEVMGVDGTVYSIRHSSPRRAKRVGRREARKRLEALFGENWKTFLLSNEGTEGKLFLSEGFAEGALSAAEDAGEVGARNEEGEAVGRRRHRRVQAVPSISRFPSAHPPLFVPVDFRSESLARSSLASRSFVPSTTEALSWLELLPRDAALPPPSTGSRVGLFSADSGGWVKVMEKELGSARGGTRGKPIVASATPWIHADRREEKGGTVPRTREKAGQELEQEQERGADVFDRVEVTEEFGWALTRAGELDAVVSVSAAAELGLSSVTALILRSAFAEGRPSPLLSREREKGSREEGGDEAKQPIDLPKTTRSREESESAGAYPTVSIPRALREKRAGDNVSEDGWSDPEERLFWEGSQRDTQRDGDYLEALQRGVATSSKPESSGDGGEHAPLADFDSIAVAVELKLPQPSEAPSRATEVSEIQSKPFEGDAAKLSIRETDFASAIMPEFSHGSLGTSLAEASDVEPFEKAASDNKNAVKVLQEGESGEEEEHQSEVEKYSSGEDEGDEAIRREEERDTVSALPNTPRSPGRTSSRRPFRLPASAVAVSVPSEPAEGDGSVSGESVDSSVSQRDSSSPTASPSRSHRGREARLRLLLEGLTGSELSRERDDLSSPSDEKKRVFRLYGIQSVFRRGRGRPTLHYSPHGDLLLAVRWEREAEGRGTSRLRWSGKQSLDQRGWKPRVCLALPFVRAIASGLTLGGQRYRLLRDAFAQDAVIIVADEEWQSAKAVRRAAITAIAELSLEALDISDEASRDTQPADWRRATQEEGVDGTVIRSHLEQLEKSLSRASADAEEAVFSRLARSSTLSAEEWIGAQDLPPLYLSSPKRAAVVRGQSGPSEAFDSFSADEQKLAEKESDCEVPFPTEPEQERSTFSRADTCSLLQLVNSLSQTYPTPPNTRAIEPSRQIDSAGEGSGAVTDECDRPSLPLHVPKYVLRGGFDAEGRYVIERVDSSLWEASSSSLSSPRRLVPGSAHERAVPAIELPPRPVTEELSHFSASGLSTEERADRYPSTSREGSSVWSRGIESEERDRKERSEEDGQISTFGARVELGDRKEARAVEVDRTREDAVERRMRKEGSLLPPVPPRPPPEATEDNRVRHPKAKRYGPVVMKKTVRDISSTGFGVEEWNPRPWSSRRPSLDKGVHEML